MTDEQKRPYERDSLCNAVLNEDQYDMYREWFKNNPHKSILNIG